MQLLHPRAVYRRANSEEPDSYQSSTVELSSINSTYSSNSATETLLTDPAVLGIRSDSPLRILHIPLFGLKRYTRLRGFHGWRVGALAAAALALLSLLINIAVVAWLGSQGKGAGLIEVFKGSCSQVQQMDIWTHLAINALSTLLLGGSNYCMQCLCAPTRTEVDSAHSRGTWMDIGVPSVRNLGKVSRPRVMLWWMLGLSSVPLHLMYNSAFFKSLSTNDYDMFFVRQGFVDGGNFTVNGENVVNTINIGNPKVEPEAVQQSLLNTNIYERLAPTECVRAYANNFLSDRRNLVVVSNNGTSKNSLLFMPHYAYTDAIDAAFGRYLPFDWICQSDPTIKKKLAVLPQVKGLYNPPCGTYVSDIIDLAERGEWEPYGFNVQYCLSERVPQTCSYSGNVPIIVVVIVCNALKIMGMLIVAFGLRDSPLITIGDAAQSFLNHPDSTTADACLLSKKDVTHSRPLFVRAQGQLQHTFALEPRPANLRRLRWWRAASLRRWLFTIGFILLAIAIISVLLAFAIIAINLTGVTISSLGLGRVDAGAIIQGWSVSDLGPPAQKIIGSILVANLPQAILSFIYLHLNGLLTSMFLASEWSDYSKERKGLRVSNPKPDTAQRSTYFLQLPYRIAIPLVILSGVLHWLVSQSIFLAVVASYAPTGVLSSSVAVASCGFSPMAMIVVLGIGVAIVIVAVSLGGLRRFHAGMPLVGSCSAAISAACHAPSWDVDASLKTVKWGVIPGTKRGDVWAANEVWHCALSSGEVEEIQEGKLYAGQ